VEWKFRRAFHTAPCGAQSLRSTPVSLHLMYPSHRQGAAAISQVTPYIQLHHRVAQVNKSSLLKSRLLVRCDSLGAGVCLPTPVLVVWTSGNCALHSDYILPPSVLYAHSTTTETPASPVFRCNSSSILRLPTRYLSYPLP
jgi:hypothetical protein